MKKRKKKQQRINKDLFEKERKKGHSLVIGPRVLKTMKSIYTKELASRAF
jgi:hypothetical protein